ncbi:MAG: hypothetical protein AABX53_03955 [Nanoarchaeota archaeon]
MREKRDMSDLELWVRHKGAWAACVTSGVSACASLIPFCVGAYVCQDDRTMGLSLLLGGLALGALGIQGANYFFDVTSEYQFEMNKRQHTYRG